MAALRRGRASSATRSPTTLSVRAPRDMTKWCVNAGLFASPWWKGVTSPGGDVDLVVMRLPAAKLYQLPGRHPRAGGVQERRARIAWIPRRQGTHQPPSTAPSLPPFPLPCSHPLPVGHNRTRICTDSFVGCCPPTAPLSRRSIQIW